MAKTVLVTGDVFLQENLLAHHGAKADGTGAFDPLAVHRLRGGACRLADLVCAAIEKGMEATVAGPNPPDEPCRSFAVWAPFLPAAGKSVAPKDMVWRIEKYLGAQRCGPPDRLAYQADEIDSPDVLLIEDLNLGFRDHEHLWPKALLEGGANTSIVLRTCAPLGDGPLWQRLLQDKDRLTVAVPADALRARGAGLTAPLSWDQTIEEIAIEFEGARFVNDLALVRRVVVQFGADGAASFARLPLFGERDPHLSDRVCFERCLYDPKSLEGAWKAKFPGLSPEGTSILAAAMARHELDPETYPLFVALGRGLAAIRKAHETGSGLAHDGVFSLTTEPIRDVLHPAKGEPEAAFYTAFPHSLLDDEKLRQRPASQSDLLRDFTGSGFESVVSTGIDVVLRGVEAALKPVPKATYGKYTTADRDEIERINSIRNLIVGYLDNPKDARPLSFAVFGPPGSGKSFAVKQLMRDIAGDSAMSLEFNLSQISGLAELHQAFHRVRDASIQSRVPFVFWDEFDTKGLDWLKDFLAPMQDSTFHAGGVQHSFGKAIFVFAGGTAPSLAEFNLKQEDPRYDEFKKMKGPDFVSRLRGHVDVKGPNPEKGAAGYAHVIRRAILLRKLLEGNAPRLIDQETKLLAMDAGVLRAFLTVEAYVHGARSLEAVVTMSNLTRASFYGLAELPTRDLLNMHVSEDFGTKAHEPALGVREIEALADAAHDAWCKSRRAQGYVYGPERNNKANPPTHPLLKPFKDLPPEKQESNRASVRSALVVFAASGYHLVPATKDKEGLRSLDAALLADLKPVEHNRWLRERLQTGWAWCDETNDGLRLHADLTHFDDLPAGEAPLDELVYKTILTKLPDLGFVVAKKKSELEHQLATEGQTIGQDASGARS